MLAQYLWSYFLRGELSQIRDQMNSSRILKRATNKGLPTVGSTPNAVFTLPGKYGMKDCLGRFAAPPTGETSAQAPMPVPAQQNQSTDVEANLILPSIPSTYSPQSTPSPMDILQHAKAALGGDALLAFVSEEYSLRADAAFRDLGIPGLTYHNIWDVFSLMLPVILARAS